MLEMKKSMRGPSRTQNAYWTACAYLTKSPSVQDVILLLALDLEFTATYSESQQPLCPIHLSFACNGQIYSNLSNPEAKPWIVQAATGNRREAAILYVFVAVFMQNHEGVA